MVLVLCEMQSVLFRFWTRVAVSITYDDNHYTTGTSTLLSYIYIYILELSWQENPANTGDIRNSEQLCKPWSPPLEIEPTTTVAETLPLSHRFMSHISDAELTSHGDNAWPLDLMCREGTYSLQRIRPPPGLRLPKSVLWIHITLTSWEGNRIILNLKGGINVILEVSWLKNSANTYMWHTEHWTAVLTLLGLINSAYIYIYIYIIIIIMSCR